MVFALPTKSLFSFACRCISQNQLSCLILVKPYSKKFGTRNSSGDGKSCDNKDQEETTSSSPMKPHCVGTNVAMTSDQTSGNQNFGKQNPETRDEPSNSNFNLQDMLAMRTTAHNKLMDSKRSMPLNSRQNAKFSTKMNCNMNKNFGRHQYHEDCECAISQQIYAELNAALAYLSMACYFGRTEVALPGCQGFFLKMHEEEMGHAMQFIDYQLMRGGRVYWFPISIPDSEEFDSIVKAFSVATEMEKLVKEKIQCVHDIAEKHRDLQMQDLMINFLDEQNKSICEMARLQFRANKMCQDASGEFLFDKELFEGWVRKFNKNAIYK